MSLMKYGIYIAVILIVAFMFEQIATFLYDLTVQGIAGEINAYILLAVMWIAFFILSKFFLNKKIHPQSSQFVLWASMLHIGTSLAIFFYNTNPILLSVFPVLIAITFLMRQKRTPRHKSQIKLLPIHPLFVDDRGGVCVVRNGSKGFIALKFLIIEQPMPIKDFILYLFHQQIESTFEICKKDKRLVIYLGLITRGRNYDLVHQQCLEQLNKLRQFFKKINIISISNNDYLNALKIFYAPYFLYKPSVLNERGLPLQFPILSSFEQEIIIEDGFNEISFTLHSIHPNFKPNHLYQFLDNIEEDYYLQLHLRPLKGYEIKTREERFNEQYRESLRRLTQGLEENSEFQAASYLFNQVGETEKENIAPLLNQHELDLLNDIKKKIRQTKNGRTIGLWEFETYLIASPVLAQTLAIKLGGSKQIISPHALCSLACRMSLGDIQIVDSKGLSTMFPNQQREMEGIEIGQKGLK